VALLLVSAEGARVAPELVSRLACTNPAFFSSAREGRDCGGCALRSAGHRRSRGNSQSGVNVSIGPQHASDQFENSESECNGFISADASISVEVNRVELLIDFLSGGGSAVAAGGLDGFRVINSCELLAASNSGSRPLSEFSAINVSIRVGVEFRECLECALANGLLSNLITRRREVE
jgi:hypothetical protein